jgi:uncharacterized membrane protein
MEDRMTNVFRFVSAAALVAVVAACKSVNAVPAPWAAYIANKQPATVWATRSKGSVVKVSGPRVYHDTLIGAVNGEYTEIPLADITRVSAEHSDKTKTILAAAAGGAVTVGALVYIFSVQGSSQNNTPTGVGGVPCDPDTGCGPGQ